MRSTTLLSIVFCSLLAHAAPVSPQGEGYGWATGTAKATYVFRAPGGPRPPDYKNDGYTQTVSGADGEWIVRVGIDLTPLRVRAPFRPGVIPSADLPKDLAEALSQDLAPCRRADEAVNAVLLFLKRSIRYAEKPGFDESLQQVFARREASCVGFTRAACALIGGLGIPCREVVGLKVPPGLAGVWSSKAAYSMRGSKWITRGPVQSSATFSRPRDGWAPSTSSSGEAKAWTWDASPDLRAGASPAFRATTRSSSNPRRD